MKRLMAFAALAVSCSSSADVRLDFAPDAEAVARLHAARTLKCRFTAMVSTSWDTFGRRDLNTEHLDIKSQTLNTWYRNIDLERGTARVNATADLTVKLDRKGALWMFPASSGEWNGIDVTTIFPIYAIGSHEFIVVQSSHSWSGKSASGNQVSGTCSVE